MNKKERSIFFKLLTLGSVGFLSACTLFLGTYAWFSANEVVSGNNMGVTVKNIDIVEEVIFHKYYQVEGTATGTYTFDVNGSDDYDFGVYSWMNKHCQSLIEVKLKKESSINISTLTDATYYLGDGVKNSDGQLLHALQENNNSLTSIVEFYSFSADDVVSNGTYLTLNKGDSTSQRKSFVNDTHTDLIESEIIDLDTQQNVTSFFIMIDYDILSISTIYAANLGNPVFESSTVFGFDIDFAFDVTLAGE